MSSRGIGPLAQAWYRWKALRLPWRKRFLVGYDLAGNTFWEFRLTTRGADSSSPSSERWRRIVKYPRSTHYSAVKVSPQWHQWLRHTRHDPPSVDEQQGDIARQARLKYLAAQADARWEAKPRVMEAPEDKAQTLPPLDTGGVREEETGRRRQQTGEEGEGSGAGSRATKATDKDPWGQARSQGPSEKWQPSAWTPPSTKPGQNR